MRDLKWGEKGLGGMSSKMLERELTSEQLLAVAVMLGVEEVLAGMRDSIRDTPPLRLAEPSVRLQALELALESVRNAPAVSDDQLPTHSAASRSDHSASLRFFQQSVMPWLTRAAELNDADVVLLFDISAQLAAMTLDEGVMAQQQRLYALLKQRSLPTQRGIDALLIYPLANARQFEQVQALIAVYPDLHRLRLPKLDNQVPANFQGRSVYAYDAQSDTLIRQPFEASSGKQLLMVVGMGCHFSMQALEALNQNPHMMQMAKQYHLNILTPPASAAPTWMMRRWNQAHPQQMIKVASNPKEWAEIDVPSVPQFYLLEQGKITPLMTGWTGDDAVQTLNAALQKHPPTQHQK